MLASTTPILKYDLPVTELLADDTARLDGKAVVTDGTPLVLVEDLDPTLVLRVSVRQSHCSW